MKYPIIKYNDKILNNLSWFMKIGGITFFPWIILREKYRDDINYKDVNVVKINHETIHIKQQQELLILPFYIWYFIEWLIKLLKYGNKAYYNISFEREAHENDEDLNYLNNRKVWSFIKYLFK